MKLFVTFQLFQEIGKLYEVNPENVRSYKSLSFIRGEGVLIIVFFMLK